MNSPETSANSDQPEFKPAVNAADLISGGLVTPEQRTQVETDRQARETHRQELLDQGFTVEEAGSIINSGYVMREVHEASKPSQAYLDHVAGQAAPQEQSAENEDLPRAA